jgi:signal transduction histidine kinase/ActR/RegA family two-component response regulator
VADALASNHYKMVRDQIGLVHFAVPLALGEHRLGAVVAGQVIDQYPEQLEVERASRHFGLSMTELWQLVRLETPVRRSVLEIYADLLATFAANSLRNHYHTVREAEHLAQETRLSDQLRRRTEELDEADRRKNEFLAMLAHELRNPLAAILYAVEVAKLGGSEGGHATEIVEHQVTHLTHVIGDLLDIARITRGTIRLKKEPTDAADLIRLATETARPAIDRRRHELCLGISDEAMPLLADVTRIEQVLVNLLTNAAKYMSEGGRIDCSACRQEDQAVFRVRDTGIGIPEHMLAGIFDLFSQVDQSLDRSQGGLGIGLTIARQLVEAHEGTIIATSEGLGRGSEFVVRLPLAASIMKDSPVAAHNDVPLSPLKILVVEDNESASTLLSTLLRSKGHVVEVAGDGLAAIERAGEFRPDVVLLDIGLPRLDGYQVAHRLRQSEATEAATIIGLSGYEQRQCDVPCSAADFDHHVVKPVGLNQLLPLLRPRQTAK